ncbi:MAG: MBL fold metallo-hydrolase [Hyphomicrobiales bacterium]|nr:MBL fold metallo-hydrolase [Hyphomicrobiales bacterium]
MVQSFLRASLVALCCAAPALAGPKEAEPATRAANAAVQKALDLSEAAALEDARRGFIAAPADQTISGPKGAIAYSMKPYAFLNEAAAPDTVNPSLWRQARLNAQAGLFKVTDRVYQFRGYDISNMTIVEGDNGLIIIDPLLTVETSRAGLDLYYANRPHKPVAAVIYTHSHADHFGGVKGVVDEADVKAGKVKIFAPDHFMDFAVSENLIAGNAMSRRAAYQFGSGVTPGPRGQVDTGLGKALARGTFSLIAPTDLVKKDYETHVIEGVEITFHLTPGTEAPAEMTMYFPQFRLIDAAELATQNMHNLYTIRGAEVRDARAWSRYISDMVEQWSGKADVLIAQHNWPTWGGGRIVDFLQKQRDLYKFMHDQSVRLLNKGYTPTEIAETLKLPKSLAENFATRGYYGTLSHNSKAVYQRYLGWYDANPAHLAPLPAADNAKKTIAYMGGADAVLAKAREDFKAGEYRWVASVMSDLVFAEPNNQAARELGADALEQLGYQAEGGTWRNAYLTGAQELREGPPKAVGPSTLAADMMKGIPTDMLFDVMAVRLNADKAEGKTLAINWIFPDTNEKIAVNLQNSALTQVVGKEAPNADATFTLARATLNEIFLKQRTFLEAIKAGDVKFSGNPLKLAELMGALDDFPPNFPIVEPKATR